MLAEVATVAALPSAFEQVVSYAHRDLMPALSQDLGNLGVALMGDPDVGRCVLVSYWEDEQALRSSVVLERASWPPAEDIVREFAEVGFLVQWQSPLPGSVVRILSCQVRPNDVYAGVAYFEADLLPPLELAGGLSGCVLLFQRGTGRMMALLSFEKVHVATASSIIDDLGQNFIAKMRVREPRVDSYQLIAMLPLVSAG